MQKCVVAALALIACTWGSSALAQVIGEAPNPSSSSNADSDPFGAPGLSLPDNWSSPGRPEYGTPNAPSSSAETHGSVTSEAWTSSGRTEFGAHVDDEFTVSPGEPWIAPYFVEGEEMLDPDSN